MQNKGSKTTTHNIPKVKLNLIPRKASPTPQTFSAALRQKSKISHKVNEVHSKQITVCLEIDGIANFITLKLAEGSTCAQLLCKVDI